MVVVRVLPGLRDGAVVEGVRLVRPDAVHEARSVVFVVVEDGVQRLIALGLDLGVGPTGDLGVVVDDALVLGVGVEGDIVPEGDGVAVLLEPDAPILDWSAQYPRREGDIHTMVFLAPTSRSVRSLTSNPLPSRAATAAPSTDTGRAAKRRIIATVETILTVFNQSSGQRQCFDVFVQIGGTHETANTTTKHPAAASPLNDSQPTAPGLITTL